MCSLIPEVLRVLGGTFNNKTIKLLFKMIPPLSRSVKMVRRFPEAFVTEVSCN